MLVTGAGFGLVFSLNADALNRLPDSVRGGRRASTTS
jgi:hypothetical protein